MTRTVPLAILFAFLLGMHVPPTANPVSAREKSATAPAFALELLDGGTLRTSELKGKLLVLKFVASY